MEEVEQFDNISIEDLAEGSSNVAFAISERCLSADGRKRLVGDDGIQNSQRTRHDTSYSRMNSTMTMAASRFHLS